MRQCANYSRDAWRVSATDGALRATQEHDTAPTPTLPPHFVPTKAMRGRLVSARVSDGWLIGADAGEWGGGLWWTDPGGLNAKQLLTRNVHAIFARGQETLVLTGVAHMGIDEGAAWAYRDGGAMLRVADLGSSPGAFAVAPGREVLIVTNKGVLRLTTANAVEPLLSNDSLSGLYPESLALGTGGEIFVGHALLCPAPGPQTRRRLRPILAGAGRLLQGQGRPLQLRLRGVDPSLATETWMEWRAESGGALRGANHPCTQLLLNPCD